MKKNLNLHLRELSNIIERFKQENEGAEELDALEQSLDLLSQKIKTEKLNRAEWNITENHNIQQDASFCFDANYNIVRYTGFDNHIFGRNNYQNKPGIDEFLDKNSRMVLRNKTNALLKTGEEQEFKVKVISVNQILLPATVLLEKISFGNGRDLISAGLVFTGQDPEDLKDYQEILIKNLPDMDVCLFDTKLTHALAGGKEKERFKITNSEFTGKTFYEVYSKKVQKRLYPFYKNALEGNVSEGEVRIADQIYYISSTPVKNINNQVAGGALIAQNVTKEKEVEQKLRQSKKEAEDADRTKSFFLARMSHEMRTPLNAIIGFNGLLNKTDLTPKQKEFSHLIGQSSEHLLSVVNEILFLFKLGMGKVFIENIAFNMHELIDSVHESMLLQAKKKNLRFDVSVDDDVPEVVIGDPFRLKQIIMNLVSNAIKFTEKGLVSVGIRTEKIRKQKIALRFEVKDTGIGILKKDLEKIYDEFSQSDFKTEKSKKGAGLGLTISKKLVGLLNGRMSVESELNKGSVFTVIIPFKRSKTGKSVVRKKKYNIDFNQLEGKKILFADDDENNVLLAENILSDWNTDYNIAKDGERALNLLREQKYDIVLLDIHMPVLSGLDVLREIRENRKEINHQTKAMAVTANILKSDLDNYLNSGFNDYILKPFSEGNLYSKICSLLDVKELRHSKQKDSAENTPQDENERPDFDTSMLVESAGKNPDFYNHMLTTFITNANQTKQDFVAASAKENWKKVGEKAHKAIPSFKYFGLAGTVKKLIKLEDATIREPDESEARRLTDWLVKDIERIITLAEEAKVPGQK